MNWYIEVLKKYAVFDGRSRRKEYWFFTLFNMIAYIGLIFVDVAIGTFDPQSGIGILSTVYILGVILPSIGVLIRRLHDIGRSGWWWLLLFVPIIGPIALFVMTVMESNKESNSFGPNPVTT